MKYAAWTDRTGDEVDGSIDRQVRMEAQQQGFTLPSPIPYWKRETGHAVELSSEFRPGYRSIWLWEV